MLLKNVYNLSWLDGFITCTVQLPRIHPSLPCLLSLYYRSHCTDACLEWKTKEKKVLRWDFNELGVYYPQSNQNKWNWMNMTTYDNLWQLMPTYDSLWQLMTAYDSLWQLWQLLTTFDNFWQLLTTFHNFWQLLTTFDKFWQLSSTFINFWQLILVRSVPCFFKNECFRVISMKINHNSRLSNWIARP